MSKIKDIVAREILDSRGNPTIEVKVFTEKGSVGIFSVPSGASTGKKEALELRDNDERYMGKGVRKAVSNVNNIIKDKLIGFSVENQKSIDELLISLDGTPNKSNLGANAILGVSVACLKAAALDNNEELFRYLNKREAKIPYCMFNVLNGGKHAPNNVDIQEFMIVPKFDDFKTSLRVASEIFHNLKTLLEEKELVTSVGDEGGFAPDLDNNEEALMILVKSIEMSGYIPGKNVFIALDVAASSFYNNTNDTYRIDKKNITREELLEYYTTLVKKYPIISIEDPFDEDDEVIGMQMESQGEHLLVVSENGMGKRTLISEFNAQIRGGKGVLCYKVTEKTGYLIGAKLVNDGREIMLITTEGIVIRMSVDDISVIGRNTSGVKLMNIDQESDIKVASIAKVRESATRDNEAEEEELEEAEDNTAETEENDTEE